MKFDVPENLHPTCETLAGSLRIHPAENAPRLPDDLLNDMASHFCRAPAKAHRSKPQSFFAALQSLIALPSFGVAAFAMVTIGLMLPTMINRPQSTSGFRGAISDAPATQNVSIILVNAPSGISQFLEQSGDFEKGTITTAENSEANGARILVDFEFATIKAINAHGDETFSSEIPQDKSLMPAAIAKAISYL